jgi:hypothetical protein
MHLPESVPHPVLGAILSEGAHPAVSTHHGHYDPGVFGIRLKNNYIVDISRIWICPK